MTISAILRNKGGDILSVTSDAKVSDAVALLAEKRIGALPVIDGGKVLGIFSERDVLYGLAREGAAVPGGCRITGPHGNLTHEGIDHILISASLKRRLTAGALSMRVVNFADAQGGSLRATPDLAMPSDHCPHVVEWSAAAH